VLGAVTCAVWAEDAEALLFATLADHPGGSQIGNRYQGHNGALSGCSGRNGPIIFQADA
jgi:hypothetical protein